MAESEPVMEDPFSAAAAVMSTGPQGTPVSRIVQEVLGSLNEMKTEYNDYRYPLTDDCQWLQKFCIKLEYCIQYGMKQKNSLLGGKKDYWNFILECLSGNKGLGDGIRFVKSTSELKTNLGKGRALVRFALIHQRLADTLQQCSISPRVISDWYQRSSLWYQPKICSELLNALYDLNDIQFDLSPRGYDLDTSWPSFARRTLGSTPQAWIAPSRTTSITSLSSIPALEIFPQASPSPSPHVSVDPDILRLQHDLTTSEYKREDISQQLESLRDSTMAAEQTAGDLQQRVKQLEGLVAEKEKRCNELQALNDQVSQELKLKEEAWVEKETLLKWSADEAEKKLSTINQENLQANQGLRFDTVELAGKLLASQKITEALRMELKSAELRVESTQRVDVQKTRLIELLDKKLEQVQIEKHKIADMVEGLITDKEKLAGKLKEATFNITDMATRLSESEKRAKALRNTNKEFLDMLHNTQDKGTQIAKVAKEKLVKYSEENKQLKAEIASLGDEGTKVSEEVDKADKLSQCVTQLEEMQSKLGGLDSLAKDSPDSDVMKALKSSENMNIEIRAEVNRLKADLKVKEGFIEQERGVLREKIVSLEKERDELKKALVGKPEMDTITKLTTDRTSIKSVLEEKKKVLEKAQAEASKLREALQAKLAEGKRQETGGEGTPEGETAEEDIYVKTAADVECLVCSLSNILESVYSDEVIENELDRGFNDTEAYLKQAEHLEGALVVVDLEKAELAMALSHKDEQIERMEKVQEDKEAILRENQSRIANLERELNLSEHTLDQFKQEMKSSTNTTTEKDSTISNLTSSLEDIGQTLNRVMKEKEECTILCNQLNKEVQDKITKAEEQTRIIKSLEKTVEGSEIENKSISEDNLQIKSKINRLEKEIEDQKQSASELEKSLNFSAEEKTSLLHSKVKHEQKLNSQLQAELLRHQDILVTERKEQASLLESSKTDVSKLIAEVQTIQSELNNFRQESRKAVDLISDLEKQRDGLLGEMKEKESNIQSTKLEMEQNATGASRLEEELQFVNKDLAELKTVLDEERSKRTQCESSMVELEANVEAHQQSVLEKEMAVTSLTEHNETLEKSLADKERELCGVQDKLKFLEESRTTIQVQFDENQLKLNEMKQKVNQLETDNNVVTDSLRISEESATEILKSTESENVLLREKIESLLSEKDTMCQKLTEEKSILQDQLVALNKEFETKSANACEIQDTLDNTKSELQNSSEQLGEVKMKLKVAEEESALLKGEFERKIKDVEEKHGQYEKAKNTEINRLKEDFEITKESLERRGKLWDGERSGLEQELSALKFQLSSEQMENQDKLQSLEEKNTDVNTMRDRVSQQEALIETLEVELKAQQAEREEEREHSWDQIKKLKDKLSDLETDHLHLNETYSKTKSNLHELTSSNKTLKTTLEETIKSSGTIIETSNERIKELETDCLELKKKLIQLVREKDTLWQKTDQLEYEQKLRSAETWMDSGRVTSCLDCKTDFSILRRKHHCRMCGRIFCWECCNNWVMTAHSHKKERVCNKCNMNMSQLSSAGDGEEEDSPLPEPDMFKSVEIPVKRSRKWTESAAKASPEDEDEPEDTEAVVGSAALADLATSAIVGAGYHTSTPIKGRDGAESSEAEPDLQLCLATDEERLLMMTDDTKSEQAAGQSRISGIVDDEVYDFITDDEIAKSIMDPIPDPNMTITESVSSESLLLSSVEAPPELWINAGKSLAIPIHIDSSGITISWEFTTQPKPIHFSMTYKETEFMFNDESEELIPSTKCNSHKEAITGEMIARKPGIYMLIFDNGPSRFTAKLLNYKISAKVAECADSPDIY